MIVSEKVYEFDSNGKQLVDSQLNPFECIMLNDSGLYSVHAEDSEIEKQSILNTNLYYFEHKRKELLSDRVKFRPNVKRVIYSY